MRAIPRQQYVREIGQELFPEGPGPSSHPTEETQIILYRKLYSGKPVRHCGRDTVGIQSASACSILLSLPPRKNTVTQFEQTSHRSPWAPNRLHGPLCYLFFRTTSRRCIFDEIVSFSSKEEPFLPKRTILLPFSLSCFSY